MINPSFTFDSGSGVLVHYCSQSSMFSPAGEPVNLGKMKIAPWGENNDLPLQVVANIERSEVVSSNLQFNIAAGYGLGVRPLMKINDGKYVEYVECNDEEVLGFFDSNDIDGFFLEQLSDLLSFNNVFPEIILNEQGDKIVSLRSLEATFSRWGVVEDPQRGISKHYLCADWSQPAEDEVVETEVLPRYRIEEALRDRIRESDNRRFVYQLKIPVPGKTYYSQPAWWSIFKSGWFDISGLIPQQKLACLKNRLAVRYIVYIDDEYWVQLASAQGINLSDTDRLSQLKTEETKRIVDFLKNTDGKGGGFVTTKKTSFASTGKALESKYIDIVTVKSELATGELIEDSEEASNIISYAMGVHPSLNGATPGKTSGSLGGSDKRELYMIKQSMMQPFRDRLLRVLYFIKKYNNWPSNLVFGVPEYQFPTLDVSKDGKEVVNQK